MQKPTYWAASVGITILLRLWLLVMAAVPFNGDEAVVALMARHILQGARPRFFYGQAYMGSLDAYLIAGGFAVFGEHIWVIRVVQMLLYCGFIYTAWLLARRLFADPRAADYTALLLAVPPVVVTLYTTATLGGYGETLIFGNLILLLGYEVVYGNWQDRPVAWLALGLVGGLAFWTLGLAAVYLLPVGVVGLLRLRAKQLPLVLLGAAGFFAGALPWWLENFANDWAALTMQVSDSPLELVDSTWLERLVGFFALGLPAILGLRWPWSGAYEPVWIAVPALLVFVGLLIFLVEIRRRKLAVFTPGAGRMLFVFGAGFFLFFVGTQFGVDSTGRYMIPLYVGVVLGLAGLAAFLGRKVPQAGWVLVGLVLLMNLASTFRAANTADGLTTQIDPISRFDNTYDEELIAFLREKGITRGYSNYWVTYRIAFLSQEELIFVPRLPYKQNMSYTYKDSRYAPYEVLVAESEEVAYITTVHQELDARLAAEFARLGVTYWETQIGPYHLYYGLSETVRPEELDIFRDP